MSAAALEALAPSQVGSGLRGGREEVVQRHQLFPGIRAKTLASAKNSALCPPPPPHPESVFRTVKSFHHKGSIQETKVRSKRSYLKLVKASQALGFLH